ncbi:MAG: BON domain-containing protein [Sulfitobacter sp.]
MANQNYQQEHSYSGDRQRSRRQRDSASRGDQRRDRDSAQDRDEDRFERGNYHRNGNDRSRDYEFGDLTGRSERGGARNRSQGYDQDEYEQDNRFGWGDNRGFERGGYQEGDNGSRGMQRGSIGNLGNRYEDDRSGSSGRSSWNQGDSGSDSWRTGNPQSQGQSHRGRGPKNYKRSDDRISEDVCDRLSDDHDLDASDIDVSVSDREVTLSGEVDSKQAKRHAEDCADSCSGVEHVQNNLRVKKSRSHNDDEKMSASKSK